MMLENNPQKHDVDRRVSAHSLTEGIQTTVPRTVAVAVHQNSRFNPKEIARKSLPLGDRTQSYQPQPNHMGLTTSPSEFSHNLRSSINTDPASGQRSLRQDSNQQYTEDEEVQDDSGADNNENDVVDEALDMMMVDLMSAKQETIEKQEALDQANAELSNLRQTVHGLRTEKQEDLNQANAELSNLRQTNSRLTTRLIEDGDVFKRKENEFLERIATAESHIQSMQETHSQLNTEAERWKTAATSKQKESETANSSSQALLQQHESLKLKLQELQGVIASKDAALSQSQAEKQQVEMQAYQLQNTLAAMQQETQQQAALQKQHADLLDSHAAELAEMRRMADHFKTTSQKLSAANKRLTAANTGLQDSLQNVTRDLKERKNQIQALYDENAELQNRLGSR